MTMSNPIVSLDQAVAVLRMHMPYLPHSQTNVSTASLESIPRLHHKVPAILLTLDRVHLAC